MVLMAMDVGRGDAVFCPSFTFCATGEAVALTGATPVFVDVDEATFNIDAASLKRGIATARKLGLRPRAVIPVDLFGQSADHDAIGAVAEAEGLFVLDDAAQGFGASYKGRRLGTLGLATATSFFPAKPLGCYGDGGAIFTDDAELADTLRSIRVHGQGTDKYDNVRLGLTGRLDTMQAAILIEKLKIFDDEIAARNAGRRALCARPRQCRDRSARSPAAAPRSGRNTPSGCPGHRPRRLCRRAQGAGHSDRDLLCEVDASADRLSGFPGRRAAACRPANGSPTMSSACRCMPISTSRRRSGSSRLCAAHFLPDFAILQRPRML